jgi:restriction system protein
MIRRRSIWRRRKYLGQHERDFTMLGHGAIGEHAIGESGRVRLPVNPTAQINVASSILSSEPTAGGTLITATTAVWENIVAALGKDWSAALTYTPRQWEEIVAGAFKRLGFDQVTLTPQRGDFGRDVIAVSAGFLSQKVVVSVKANAPGNLVSYDDVRALMGVISAENDVTKGMLTTTSDFPPNLHKDPLIASFQPTRLELINGKKLRLMLSGALKPTANSENRAAEARTAPDLNAGFPPCTP